MSRPKKTAIEEQQPKANETSAVVQPGNQGNQVFAFRLDDGWRLAGAVVIRMTIAGDAREYGIVWDCAKRRPLDLPVWRGLAGCEGLADALADYARGCGLMLARCEDCQNTEPTGNEPTGCCRKCVCQNKGRVADGIDGEKPYCRDFLEMSAEVVARQEANRRDSWIEDAVFDLNEIGTGFVREHNGKQWRSSDCINQDEFAEWMEARNREEAGRVYDDARASGTYDRESWLADYRRRAADLFRVFLQTREK